MYFNDNNLRRGHDMNIYAANRIPTREIYFNLYTYRIIKLWNNIPLEIKNVELSDAGNNSAFKREIRKFYEKLFNEKFYVDNLCTWSNGCRCIGCRN